MKLFNFKKKNFIDLTENVSKKELNPQKETTQEASQDTGAFGFFSAMASSSQQNSEVDTFLSDKKQKLAKRLMDITDRIENLSNQIYHLQQRVEVLEKKTRTGVY